MQTQKYIKKTGKKFDPKLPSFLGGAIPDALWTAGFAVTRIRSAALWGGASVILDKLITAAKTMTSIMA